MKKLFLYILPFCLFALSSCKKNALPPDDAPLASPVFYFKCDINGAPVNIAAGVNNYYMFSSHLQDANNVYVYKADLKQNTCTNNCGYNLSVLINDFKVSQPNETMKPDSGLFLGKYEFNDGTLPPLAFQGTFYPLISGTLNLYKWTYYNGVVPQATQSSVQGNYTFKNNQTYSVSLDINKNGCIPPTHTNVFKIGNPLQVNIFANEDPILNFNYSVSATTSFTGQTWEFGDGILSQNLTPSHSFSPGYYSTKLTLTNNTDTCYSYYQTPAFYPATCNANFTSSFTPVQNSKALSAITILLTDPVTGVIYSSGALNQGTGNNFEIISVENYKANEAGQATKKVKIKFNCIVKNGANSIIISNGEAIIAVSYQ